MKVEGYEGICRACFAPIDINEGMRFHEVGCLFHQRCVEEKPNNFYIKLEKRRAAKINQNFAKGADKPCHVL